MATDGDGITAVIVARESALSVQVDEVEVIGARFSRNFPRKGARLEIEIEVTRQFADYLAAAKWERAHRRELYSLKKGDLDCIDSIGCEYAYGGAVFADTEFSAVGVSSTTIYKFKADKIK